MMVWSWLLACGSDRVDLESRAFAGEREEGEEEEEEEGGEVARPPALGRLRPGVPVVTDPTWQAECGSCHLPYSSGLLPTRSWDRLLGSLSTHFGDDASVDDATRAKLVAYAHANAADVAPYALSAALARSSAGTTPERILDIPALRHEHGEIPARALTEVKSMSSCGSCHPGAAQGRFGEGEIRIPGYGRFEDE